MAKNNMLPASTPKMSLADVTKILQKKGIEAKVAIVGIRGYYADSMGEKGKNDRGIYDDAIFVVSPTGFLACNANVDPSAKYRAGLACLKPGVYEYKIGIHGISKPKNRRYKALVQAAPVTVERDGKPGDFIGFFGINIHKGSNTTTSSLGCQTIPPAQWAGFIAFVESELKRHEQKTVPYALVVG